MRFSAMFFIVLFFLVFSFPISGQNQNNAGEKPEQKFAELGDFRLENGEVIKNCRVGYRVLGTLNESRSNAILYPSWFGGNSLSVSQWVGPGKLVDSSKYFVIVVDALGNGVSSSPSNSKDQPGAAFPKFNIRDMVRAQYQLVKTTLNIEHLYGIIGGSMGGMQVFEWVVTYPDFMDKAVAYVGTPQVTSYDMLLFYTFLHTMEVMKKYNTPEAEVVQTMRLMIASTVYSPQYRARQTSHRDFSEFIATLKKPTSTPMNSDDFISQIKAVLQHDIYASFEGSMEKAASAIKAKVFIIVCLQDHAVNPKPAMDFAKLIEAKTLILDNDMGHLSIGDELKKVSESISQFLDN